MTLNLQLAARYVVDQFQTQTHKSFIYDHRFVNITFRKITTSHVPAVHTYTHVARRSDYRCNSCLRAANRAQLIPRAERHLTRNQIRRQRRMWLTRDTKLVTEIACVARFGLVMM